MVFSPKQITAAVIDEANLWAGFRNWESCSTTDFKLIWNVDSALKLRGGGRSKVDVVFITVLERHPRDLAFLISSAKNYADSVVVAANYVSTELDARARAAGAMGVVRAGSDWIRIFRQCSVLLGVGPKLSRASRPGKNIYLTPVEEEAMRLYRGGTALMLVGSKIDKSSDWVEQVLIREGLRSSRQPVAAR